MPVTWTKWQRALATQKRQALALSPPDDSGRMAFMVYVSPHAYELLKPQDAEQGAPADGGRDSGS